MQKLPYMCGNKYRISSISCYKSAVIEIYVKYFESGRYIAILYYSWRKGIAHRVEACSGGGGSGGKVCTGGGCGRD
jgi:hypothetical protein